MGDTDPVRVPSQRGAGSLLGVYGGPIPVAVGAGWKKKPRKAGFGRR